MWKPCDIAIYEHDAHACALFSNLARQQFSLQACNIVGSASIPLEQVVYRFLQYCQLLLVQQCCVAESCRACWFPGHSSRVSYIRWLNDKAGPPKAGCYASASNCCTIVLIAVGSNSALQVSVGGELHRFCTNLEYLHHLRT